MQPGRGNPLGILVGYAILIMMPLSLGAGIVGIFRDRKKRLAILMTVVIGGLIVAYFALTAITVY